MLSMTSSSGGGALTMQGISKTYASVSALNNIDLTVQRGEFLTLLGASGSGKTTLLNIISGLTEPSSGTLYIDGVDCTRVPPYRRDIGVIFQNYSLFPHLSVSQNLAFPLEMRKVPSRAIDTKVADALKLVDLAAYGERLPAELSGGQQQRVALARCLIYQPALILMDEPLAALDRRLREDMQTEIKRLHRETGATIVFVTHDQEEALALSDRICLMNKSEIVEIASPREIYETPSSVFAASFIGASNLISGQIDGQGTFQSATGLVTTALIDSNDKYDGAATLLIRPEHIEIVPQESALISGQIVDVTYSGAETKIVVTLADGSTLSVHDHAHQTNAAIGETIGLNWKPCHARPLFR